MTFASKIQASVAVAAISFTTTGCQCSTPKNADLKAAVEDDVTKFKTAFEKDPKIGTLADTAKNASPALAVPAKLEKDKNTTSFIGQLTTSIQGVKDNCKTDALKADECTKFVDQYKLLQLDVSVAADQTALQVFGASDVDAAKKLISAGSKEDEIKAFCKNDNKVTSVDSACGKWKLPK